MAVLDQDFRLRFLGFDPSSDQKQKAKTTLYELYMEAPSESFVSVAIQPFGKKIEGWVSVHSPVQTFCAYGVGASVVEVAEKLYEQGSAEFMAWKKQRQFESEMNEAISKNERQQRGSDSSEQLHF